MKYIMVGKSRSGLANDRRAYGCDRICATKPICSSLTTVALADIATFDNNIWMLNKDTSILTCQLLIIPLNTELQTNAFTLTNNGTINLVGSIRNADSFNAGGINYRTINNGTINIFAGGRIEVVESNTNQFINNGIVNNKGVIITQFGGICINNSSGRIINTSGGEILNNFSIITNLGRIDNTTGAIINNNNNGEFNNENIGKIFNTGGFINNVGGFKFINNGIIFNNNGGIIDTRGHIFTNNGTINNANGLSTCGVGTITGGSGTITGSGTIGTACPP